MMDFAPGGQRAQRVESGLGWRSDALKCAICFAELNTTYLRTVCDHLLCKAHQREENELPHRCPACRKDLGINDLTEQDPSFFRSEEELQTFAKRLRPEEAFMLSVHATRFYVKQKQIETVIEARKYNRMAKAEARLRDYTKSLADELNVIRPECKRLEERGLHLEDQTREYCAVKEEAEAKLAQVNARYSALMRNQPFPQARHQNDYGHSPTAPYRGDRPDVYGSEDMDKGGCDATFYPGADRDAQARMYSGSALPASSEEQRVSDILAAQPPRVNKRLQPNFDSSPRRWTPGRNPSPGPRLAAGAQPSSTVGGAAGGFGGRGGSAHVDPGLLNPLSTANSPMPCQRSMELASRGREPIGASGGLQHRGLKRAADTSQQQQQQVHGGASGLAGMLPRLPPSMHAPLLRPLTGGRGS